MEGQLRLVEVAKRPFKRSFAARSAYKLLRDFRQIPRSRLLDTDALGAILRVLPNTMLPMPRLFDLYDIVKRVNQSGLKGEFVECGVWNGGAVGLMAMADQRHSGPRRKLHLFDSFEGLPQPTAFDTDVYAGFLEQEKSRSIIEQEVEQLSAIGACQGKSQPEVEEFLVKRLGIDPGKLVFHVGWFQDTVPSARDSIGGIALLRLDGDWYESTKVCIENLYDSVVVGGFVVIDDYGTFEGCRKAVDEFFAARSIRPTFTYSDAECVFFQKT
jgi:O-methyltransferase